MSLKDDLGRAVSKAEKGKRYCSVCEAFAFLPPGEGESLRKALASPLGAKRLSIILQDNGVTVGVPSIHLHRSEGHK
jgi:hypothetical protein